MTQGKNANVGQVNANDGSPKSTISQINDLSTIKTDPSTPSQQSVKKSTASISSSSHSPSSVRLNQNYDPNNIQKSSTNNDPNEMQINENGNSSGTVTDDGTNADCDLDNAEDADSKPLLNTTDNPQIVANTKRTNRYDKMDEGTAAKAESDNESETLITK